MFSFIGYNGHVMEEMTLPLSHQVHQALEIIDQLHGYDRMGVGGEGILEVSQYLSQNRGLVFWISDFHLPLTLIEQAFSMMSMHHVIPVVLWDDSESKTLPKFGFGNMIDPETGLQRTMFFRPSVRLRFEEAFAARRQALEEVFARFDSQPLYVRGAFDPETMSQYFEQWMSL